MNELIHGSTSRLTKLISVRAS